MVIHFCCLGSLLVQVKQIPLHCAGWVAKLYYGLTSVPITVSVKADSHFGHV